MDNQNKAEEMQAAARWNFLSRIKNPHLLLDWGVGALFLLLSLYTLIYYITGPAIAYFHSDCTDSLLWSQMMIESGSILSEDFAYAAILPFGSPIWMVPILKIFGYGLRAQIISMSVFAILFVLSAFSLFRSMKWKPSLSGAAAFCVSLLLSGSVKLREIMWEHVIYYSLGILLLMLMLNLAIRLYRRLNAMTAGDKSIKNKVFLGIFGVLLLLLSIGTATDGMQMVAIVALPVLGAFVAVSIFDAREKLNSPICLNRYAVSIIIALGVGIGMIALNAITKDGSIGAGYEDAYSSWSAISQWKDNADLFFMQYFSLFGIEITGGDPLFSMDSVLMLVRMICAAVILVCPILLLVRYPKLKEESACLTAWAYLVVAVIVLLGFICGKLSNVNWRLTPFLGSSLIATMVYLKELFSEHVVEKRVSVVLAGLCIAVSLMGSQTMLDMPHDMGENNVFIHIGNTLEEKGYDMGYATFWQSNNTTLLSDGRVEVVTVNIQNGTVYPRAYQTSPQWFEDREGQEDYFLLLTKDEYAQVKQSSYFYQLCQKHNLIDEFSCYDYYVLVFDGNVFLE